MDPSEKVQQARAKLAEKFGDSTKLGGKGSQRRKVKVVHKTVIKDDSKQKSIIKKFGAQQLPDIEHLLEYQMASYFYHRKKKYINEIFIIKYIYLAYIYFY